MGRLQFPLSTRHEFVARKLAAFLCLAAVGSVFAGVFLVIDLIGEVGVSGCVAEGNGTVVTAFGRSKLVSPDVSFEPGAVFCCYAGISGNRGGGRVAYVNEEESVAYGDLWRDLMFTLCSSVVILGQFLFLETAVVPRGTLWAPLLGMVGLIVGCVQIRNNNERGLRFAQQIGNVCDGKGDPFRDGDVKELCAILISTLWGVAIAVRVLLSTVKPVYVWREPDEEAAEEAADEVEREGQDYRPPRDSPYETHMFPYSTASDVRPSGNEHRSGGNPLGEMQWQQPQQQNRYSFR